MSEGQRVSETRVNRRNRARNPRSHRRDNIRAAVLCQTPAEFADVDIDYLLGNENSIWPHPGQDLSSGEDSARRKHPQSAPYLTCDRRIIYPAGTGTGTSLLDMDRETNWSATRSPTRWSHNRNPRAIAVKVQFANPVLGMTAAPAT
jgi:hypothetical protein